jgi:MFS family permease
MHTMAEAWLVYSLTDSGAAVGATFAFRFAPVFLFGLWGGAIADRYDRRRLLALTQIAQALLALVLWILVASGVVQVWMVYAVALALGLVTVVEQPAHHAFVEEMVGREQMANAVALNSAVMNSARITGPVVAGLLIASHGPSWVFLGNAASFFAVVAALYAMNTSELRPMHRSPTGVRVRDGLTHAWSVPEMRTTVALVAVVGTLVYNFPTFLTILAHDTFDGDAGTAGALMAVLGGGTLVGALVAAHGAHPTVRTVIAAAGCLGAALVGTSTLWSPVLVAIALAPVGAFAVFFGATASAHMQATSAQQFRGRVMAVYTTLTLGATIVGGPLMGEISQRWGARAGLGVAGGATTAAAAFFALAKRRGRAVSIGDVVQAEATQVAVETAT